VKAEFSLAPVAKHLSTLLAKSVQFLPDCVGPEIEGKVAALKNGEVCLLENTRFHKSETANDDEFSKQLARLADVYINDAFGAAHRAHASTVGVTKHIKQSAAGYLLRSELEQLTRLIETPEKPFVAILGGAKVPDKLKVIHNLVTKVSSVLIGGGMAYTFLRAKEIEVGDSLLDQESISMAYNAMVVAQNPHPLKRLEFLLPFDHTIASSANENTFSTSRGQSIEKGWKGVDIGPKTIEAYGQRILKAKTIFWNGPMGIFEKDNFAKGTIELARLVASATAAGAFSVVGGGDSIAAIEKAGVKDKISHVSTGGGASLEFLAGIDLPGINALSKAAKKKE
jgi:phosphoglycerate kinase